MVVIISWLTTKLWQIRGPSNGTQARLRHESPIREIELGVIEQCFGNISAVNKDFGRDYWQHADTRRTCQ